MAFLRRMLHCHCWILLLLSFFCEVCVVSVSVHVGGHVGPGTSLMVLVKE